MMKYLFLLGLLVSVAACKQDTTPTNQDGNSVNTESTETSQMLGSLPFDEMKNLYENADQIDYIYHSLPISMNVSDEAGVKNNVSFISSEANAYIPPHCKPIGRKIYYSRGEILIEADLYFNENCKFLVFIRNEKILWANKMTEAGHKFYSNLLRQVGEMQSRK